MYIFIYIFGTYHTFISLQICINGDEIQTTCENISMSPYADKDGISEKTSRPKSNCHWNTDHHTNTTAIFSPFVPYSNTASKSVHSVFINTVDLEKNLLIPHSITPNVVVEQLLQPSGSQYSFAPSLATTAATTMTPYVTTNDNSDINSEQNNQQLLAIDSIRPYIDGIEEAFQYLRSMDNNREDLLDNFLDISVSDY